MFGYCFVLQSLVCNHLDEKERACFFTSIIFLIYCDCSVMLLSLRVLRVGLVIVVFSDHTHLLFYICFFNPLYTATLKMHTLANCEKTE